MATWITVVKTGEEVVFEHNQKKLVVGEHYLHGFGFIELRSSERTGLHIVRLTRSKIFKHAVRLSRDGKYRIGTDFGHRISDKSESR